MKLLKIVRVLTGGAVLVFAVVGVFSLRATLAQQGPGAGQTAEKLPPDVHPDTLSRMAQTHREDLATDEEKAAYDHLIGIEPNFAKPVHAPLGGTGTRLMIPVVADAYRAAWNNLRSKNGVDQKYIELATMVACRESNGELEWVAHEDPAVKLNSRELIELIRNNQSVKGQGEKEEAIVEFGRQMSRGPRVTSKAFADMERLFGKKGTLDLILLMGYYENNALLLRAYDQHIDPSKKRPFPDVIALEAKSK
jgi:hypothetical protein